MKRLLIIILLIVSFMFAVTPIPRKKQKKEDKQKSGFKIESVIKDVKKIIDKTQDKDKSDRFQDADSNSVNDKREDDFQKIKQLKTKHKSSKSATGSQKKKTAKQKSKSSSKPKGNK